MKKLKIGDIFIIVLILIITVFIAFFNFEKGDKAVVEADGKIVKTFDLNKDEQFVYENNYSNTIVVKDGKVFVSDSDCPDKSCVNSGTINKSNSVICCLPNKLVIRVIGTNKNVDVISG